MTDKLNFDEFISNEAKKLTRHAAPDELWNKIENQLVVIKSRIPIRQRIGEVFKSYWGTPSLRYALAGVSVMLIAVFVWWNYSYDPDPLVEVAKMEKKYVNAIEKLEQKVAQHEPEMDIGLWVLYQERLALLDESIAACKTTLELNSENVNAHKYLRLAYQEKVITLKKLIEKQKG